jgi:uncharacterized protein YcbX
MLTVSELFIYPVKSLRGISVPSVSINERGILYDRYWMLVDDNNQFISQRELPTLALLQPSFTNEGILIQQKQDRSSLIIPYLSESGDMMNVKIWSDRCNALHVSDAADKWFSDILSFSCKLVCMPQDMKRRVDPRYAKNNQTTSFTDGFPVLLIGQSSLDDLNARLPSRVPINRFRPNIVFTGGEPFEEDVLEHFKIREVHFYGVKLCARCVIATTDQNTAERGKEPLKTLSEYRRHRNNIYFGQNLLHYGPGIIQLGDELEVLTRKAPIHFR